jgi:glycosyltransferase involved in cell wall biosynthesis
VNHARKVALAGIVGLPPIYGGFETLAHFLVLHLGEHLDFTVYCSGPAYKLRAKYYLSARLRYLPFHANGAQSIAFDLLSIFDGCFRADTILLLGVSGGIFVPLARLFGKRVVLNVGGLDWQRSKWSWIAKQFLKLSEAVAVRSSQVLIADNEGIAAYFASEYGRKSIVIEYGGDQVSLPEVTEEWRLRYPFLDAPYAFSVARIQPDNNIEMILEAFAQAGRHILVMVGNWNASTFGCALKARFADSSNLYLLDAIYDTEELNVLRGHCGLYVHGHSAGGTNPSLVEAMHLSLPIAAFDVVYNRATTEGAAQYFRSSEELADLLDRVPQDEWNDQRAKMKEIAERRYRWSVIAAKYSQAL